MKGAGRFGLESGVVNEGEESVKFLFGKDSFIVKNDGVNKEVEGDA